MSKAFDTAWKLMKAPLDVGSIDYDPAHPDPTKPIAYFDDPKSGERVPMFSRKFGNQYIRIGDRENKRAEAKLDTGGKTIGEEHTHANIHPKVNEEYRERGYATAMYDLVAHLLQQAGTGGELWPFYVQSPEAKEMWQNKQLGGREIHSNLDPDGKHIQTDWPENLYWRPTV
jgi:hypothetical protein